MGMQCSVLPNPEPKYQAIILPEEAIHQLKDQQAGKLPRSPYGYTPPSPPMYYPHHPACVYAHQAYYPGMPQCACLMQPPPAFFPGTRSPWTNDLQIPLTPKERQFKEISDLAKHSPWLAEQFYKMSTDNKETQPPKSLPLVTESIKGVKKKLVLVQNSKEESSIEQTRPEPAETKIEFSQYNSLLQRSPLLPEPRDVKTYPKYWKRLSAESHKMPTDHHKLMKSRNLSFEMIANPLKPIPNTHLASISISEAKELKNEDSFSVAFRSILKEKTNETEINAAGIEVSKVIDSKYQKTKTLAIPISGLVTNRSSKYFPSIPFKGSVTTPEKFFLMKPSTIPASEPVNGSKFRTLLKTNRSSRCFPSIPFKGSVTTPVEFNLAKLEAFSTNASVSPSLFQSPPHTNKIETGKTPSLNQAAATVSPPENRFQVPLDDNLMKTQKTQKVKTLVLLYEKTFAPNKSDNNESSTNERPKSCSPPAFAATSATQIALPNKDHDKTSSA